MNIFNNNNKFIDSKYPAISEELINKLMYDFPNRLPTDKISEFELGILIGQQRVITKLINEKQYNERDNLLDT